MVLWLVLIVAEYVAGCLVNDSMLVPLVVKSVTTGPASAQLTIPLHAKCHMLSQHSAPL